MIFSDVEALLQASTSLQGMEVVDPNEGGMSQGFLRLPRRPFATSTPSVFYLEEEMSPLLLLFIIYYFLQFVLH
jgi:hypothetical protein